MLRKLYQQLDQAQEDYDYCTVFYDMAFNNLERAHTKIREYIVEQTMDQMLFEIEWEELNVEDDIWLEHQIVSETLFEIIDKVV